MSSTGNSDKAVLFLLFNRPDLAGRVFEEIRKAAPPRLYFSVDGPRAGRNDEVELVEQCRALTEKVDWDCEVFTLFRESNLGCGKAVSSGLEWFFESEESGIILEDDCLPSPTFFPYASELLDRFQEDDRVMHVGGSNHQRGKKRTSSDYYFSRYEHVWGWASWRRAWQKYDFEMKSWRDRRDEAWLGTLFANPRTTGLFWADIFDQVKLGRIDTWDYQWRYTIWDHDGYSIIPEANLISNIGFDARATHTRDGTSLDANRPLECLSFPISHPENVVICEKADHFHEACYLPEISTKARFRSFLSGLRNHFSK